MSNQGFAKLTIVLLTRNRPLLLARALDYYSGFPCHIIVADGSDASIVSMDVSKFQNVTYYRFTDMHPSERVAQVLDTVETEFVCLTPDDDFLLMDGLVKGLAYLNGNPDYVGVQGQFASFYQEGSLVTFKKTYPENFGRNINQEGARERTLSAIRHLMHHVWGMHRIQVIRSAFSVSRQLKGLIHFEQCSIFIPLLYGKFQSLSCLWMLRDSRRYTDYTKDKGTESYLYMSFAEYRKTAEYNDYKSYYGQNMLAASGSIDDSLFDQLWDLYIELHEIPPSFLSRIRSKLISLVPKKISNTRSLEELAASDSEFASSFNEIRHVQSLVIKHKCLSEK